MGTLTQDLSISNMISIFNTLRRDTACPMTPKDRFKKNLEYRWPDAIGIGFPKCGTGTLGFIDCSSKLVFREAEPYYWNNAKRLSEGFNRKS